MGAIKQADSRPLNLHLPQDHTDAPPVILAMAFRPFFLLAACWALLAVTHWLGQLQGWWSGSRLLPATLWHAHEMLFGFAALVAAGFLLTAAQNWTGRPGLRGWPLLLSCICWLGARLSALLLATDTGLLIALVCQLLWWLLVLAALVKQLVPARSRQNYLFLPLLLLMATLNATVLWLSHQDTALASRLLQSMILLFCLLISVIGGRVIPFFTARSTTTPQPRTPRLDRALLCISSAGIAVYLSNTLAGLLPTPGAAILLASLLLTSAGLLHLLRWRYWYNCFIWQHPLLWSLHGAYLAMALGLCWLGLNMLTPGLQLWQSDAAAAANQLTGLLHRSSHEDLLHLIAISAMAGMMLSMMARVSLGHTGRPLQTTRPLAVAFGLLLLAGVIRSLANSNTVLPTHWFTPPNCWSASAVLWLLAFGIFIWFYLPILCQPRIDGRPG